MIRFIVHLFLLAVIIALSVWVSIEKKKNQELQEKYEKALREWVKELRKNG